MKTIKGHPSIELHPLDGSRPFDITVCGNCESISTILMLVGDRWYCTKCKNSGDAKPQQVNIPNPRKR